MEKVLFTATVDGHILHFHVPYLKWFKEQGYEVHVASNGDTDIPFVDVKYNVPFERSPYKLANLKAYKQLKKIINENNYKLIHCHTPVGSVLTRLAAKKVRKNGTKVIYTAHGFHFFKGAPIKNWLLYYPVELWMARYTDVIITINKEDFERAKKSFKVARVEYIPGIGIDTEKFRKKIVNRQVKRIEIGVPENAFVILSIGELNDNKNHETIIKALSKLNNTNVHYVICGKGPLENHLKNLAEKLCIKKQVHLLGYRHDIAEICKVADVFAFPSKREGLGIAALEAMASGLPIVTSNIHGILDYSINGKTGYTCTPTDVAGFAKAINYLINNKELRIKMGRYNSEFVRMFDINETMIKMTNIYEKVILNQQS